MQFRTFWKKKDEYPSLLWTDFLLEDHSENTAEISKAPLLSYFSMHLGYIELEKVCISLIMQFRTFWKKKMSILA